MARVGTTMCALLCCVLLVACSDDDNRPGEDQGPTGDGPASGQEAGTDGPLTGQDGGPDGPGQPDGPAKQDAAVTFAREVTLGYDDGLPAVKLQAIPLAEGRIKVTPESKLLPVEVRKVKFIPVTAHAGTLTVAPDSSGTPGNPVVTKKFTITSSEVDKWYTIDISSSKAVMKGTFWVSISYPSSLSSPQQVMYGGTSSSGQVFYVSPGYPIYTVNFDEILRVVLGTPDKGPPATPKSYGAACTKALECQSGYCSGGTCSKTCSSGTDCGSKGRCQTWADGSKTCVTTCTQDSDCASGAFCLTDNTFIKPAGICVRGGPFPSGKNCQYNYHTICKSGYCSACAKDPTKCDQPGSCK